MDYLSGVVGIKVESLKNSTNIMIKITESDSLYRHLEQKSMIEIIRDINAEDAKVHEVVKAAASQIEKLAEAVYRKMKEGGRLFYIGAGTSGRLGILDASECPPTYGVPADWVIGIIAGGDGAIRKAVEFAEDSTTGAWDDLSEFMIDGSDVVVGLSASGTTPYVYGGLKKCQAEGITTGSIVCNPDSVIAGVSDFPVEVITGPEYVTGSTRMKAGTAQKMVLNILTTSVMIRLGRVQDNKMVDMQLSNDKLVDRGTKMILAIHPEMDYDTAKKMLLAKGSVREALKA
jgi:N-acetylmuramic acid 6-phosphate etherase